MKESRRFRLAVLTAVVIAAIAGVLAIDHFELSAQPKRNGATRVSPPKMSPETINLPGLAFDPKASNVKGSLNSGESVNAVEGGYYIVQFGRIADDEMLDRLRQMGVEILQYLPNRAFYVYASGASAAGAAGDVDVRWVGRVLPEYKIPPVLAAQIDSFKSRRALPEGVGPLQMASKRTSVFDVAVFKHADLKTASLKIGTAVGGSIRHVIELPGNFFNIVRVESSPDMISRAAGVDEVFRIDAWSMPAAEDERAAQIVAGNYSSPTVINGAGYDPLAQFGVDGAGVTVSVVDDGVGIPGDGGFYITAGNAVNGPLHGATVGAEGHGHLNATIIAGTTPYSVLDASGYNYALGVAPKSNIINIPLLNPRGYTGTEADTVNDTVSTAGPNGVNGYISNNSWGAGTNGNTYDAYTAQYDGFARDASYAASIDPLLIVFSAGNSSTAGLTRPKMSKNTIAVANLENVRTELSATADNMDDLNGSSSLGPGPDGRIKPDIAAPGTAVAGGRSGPDGLFGNIDSFHRWSSGTSHAAPQVAGAAALFTQYWKQGHSGANPSPALVKAALINGAVDVNGVSTGAARPNGSEGWGRVNLKNVLNTGATVTYIDQADVIGGTNSARSYAGSLADAARPLRVTLVWTDPPGAADPALVNDLDLLVTVGGQTYKGNVLSGGLSVTGGTADVVNNVENVFLPPGQSGPIYVRVRAKAINGDGVLGNADPTDQHFALIVYNANVTSDTSAFVMNEPTLLTSGNGLIEPSECNFLNIPLTNGGASAATNISATLSTSTPGVSVYLDSSTYPDLTPGATAVNQSAFAVSTDNTVACFTNIDLTLTVNYTGGTSPQVYNFTLPVGQPGGTNYSFASSTGATISPGGTLVAGSDADDAVVNFTAPFAFSVYGTGVPSGSNIRLGTNGFIRIESAGSTNAPTSNGSLPSTGSGTFPAGLPVLLPYWDDLDMKPTVTTNGGVFTEVTGSPGSQTLKIEWRARPYVAGQAESAMSVNFAVYFHEGSNNFEYVYALTGPGPFAGGASATVGIQGATTGSVYTQYSFDSASLSSGQMLSATITPAVCSAGGGGCIVTAAPAQLSGRVLTADRRGIRSARVTLTDTRGQSKTAVTNSFGYFRFDGVPSGDTYIVSVAARGYVFESQAVEVTQSISDLTFVAVR